HEAMDSSQVYALAQTLLDSIGPRLTGTPGQRAAHDWAVSTYERWGIPARNEQYGTWRGWDRGITHIDLVQPRVRTLEGTMLAWSPGTAGDVLETGVVVLPQVTDAAAFRQWLPQARGKFVLMSYAEASCRPARQFQEYGMEGAADRHSEARRAGMRAWGERLDATGYSSTSELRLALEEAGAAAIVQSNWSGDYGVNKVFGTNTTRTPTIDLSCEDYGLVFRLAENDQNPVLRLRAESRFTGEQPVFNTIAEIRGTEQPDEYVMLSAHFDSWESASGATDNGTGTIMMMEAMRILKEVYPNPKRTILAGHWSGEEQGLNGSRAFAADHPEIVSGLQALFNQDNGTGRVVRISMQGLTGAGEYFARWLTRVPSEITQHIELNMPGMPGGGGSDYASFICAGAPAFSLSALNWGYGTYTWHTNRDTFDKVVVEDVKNNVALVAMLAYLAAEEPTKLPRERRVLPLDDDGEQRTWPQCRDAERTTQ
ncbi:MAG: M20/M25/M40 family metallo-hydrolase, partial [Longimicrobiales bacterium]